MNWRCQPRLPYAAMAVVGRQPVPAPRWRHLGNGGKIVSQKEARVGEEAEMEEGEVRDTGKTGE
ncbi:Hypothetical predicted protein, partial [Xyrichtys novacula]